MNENSSQTIKELSEDQEIKNSSELDNDSASQNEEDLSFEKSDIPSADSSSSRTNTAVSYTHLTLPTTPYV